MFFLIWSWGPRRTSLGCGLSQRRLDVLLNIAQNCLVTKNDGLWTVLRILVGGRHFSSKKDFMAPSYDVEHVFKHIGIRNVGRICVWLTVAICTRVFQYMHIYIYIYIHTSTCMIVYPNMYIYKYAYACIYIYIYVYIYICIHMYIYIYIHT